MLFKKGILVFIKRTAIFSATSLFISYHIKQTYNAMYKVVNPNLLDKEKVQAEHIYVEDPKFSRFMETEDSFGLARVWKSLKHCLTWRLLWLCRHGNKDQRNIALEKLAAFKNNEIWDCWKLAQALDMQSAVLLARTRGADLRYFLPPPIHVRRAALTSDLLSYKIRDLILTVEQQNPHYCIQYFLNKYFFNSQEHVLEVVETDSIVTKPDNISERDLCVLSLDALSHHVNLFYDPDYEKDYSIVALVKKNLLPILAEGLLRYPNDAEFDLAVLKVLTVVSVHNNLLPEFYQNGLIRELSRLLKSKDVRLSSSAAVCLANLSGEHNYRPGLYLLHPLYRTTTPPSCDILLVHGLRGGVFVTWRQRDRKCADPIGILEVTMDDSDCGPDKESILKLGRAESQKYFDPDLQLVIDDLIASENEETLANMEVVLHDIPIAALREPHSKFTYLAEKKTVAMKEEKEDRCTYTHCWPKDWLPKDIKNVRILGLNYWSSITEWLETCPSQSVGIATRASNLVSALNNAGVGGKNTRIVWLAHSMGGLIVKQALVQSAQSADKQLRCLSENTRALLFFSTPHKGSGIATMPRAAAALIWPSNDVRQLQVNSPTLLQLHQEFLDLANHFQWETISFAETLPTLLTAFKVPVCFVEPFSADLGRGVFYQLPLDHLSICKPATRQSILYTTLLDVLKRVSAENMQVKQRFIDKFVQYINSLFGDKNSESVDDTQHSDGTKWASRLLLN